MSYNFDYFIKQKIDEKAIISLYNIRMGGSFFKEIGNPKMVIVGFDKEKAVIGICPAPANCDYPVNKASYQNNGTVTISCVRVLSQISKYRIFTQNKFPLTRVPKIETIDNKKYIIIDLKENK